MRQGPLGTFARVGTRRAGGLAEVGAFNSVEKSLEGFTRAEKSPLRCTGAKGLIGQSGLDRRHWPCVVELSPRWEACIEGGCDHHQMFAAQDQGFAAKIATDASVHASSAVHATLWQSLAGVRSHPSNVMAMGTVHFDLCSIHRAARFEATCAKVYT